MAATRLLAILLLWVSGHSIAAVLEADRADAMYHSYQGGGMKIDGPAILIRKQASDSIAISGYYYLDRISSASVDVLSTASPYSEDRHELQLGVEYLREKTLMTLNLRQSDEDDYLARSFSVGVSQDTFGDMTNLSLGVGYGDNEVRRNGDDSFEQRAQQFRIRAGINQILTRNLTSALNLEAIVDKGYLNNPYRSVRYLDSSQPAGFGYQTEIYPDERYSAAARFSVSYFLPYRAALMSHYRYFADSWQIRASDIELGYRQPLGDAFELEFKARYYQQTQASFYADLFPYRNAQNYLARDKELSDFTDLTLGLGLTYQLPSSLTINDWPAELSLQWDHIQFDYNNFRDPRQAGGIGNEPLYQFSANVVRAFYSVYF